VKGAGDTSARVGVPGLSGDRSPSPGGLACVRLALSPGEAAESIGVSRDFFDEHVRPELRVVRRGRRVLVPVRELERWLDREACRVLDDVNGRRF
jgi:excisionase family DNA binding protein